MREESAYKQKVDVVVMDGRRKYFEKLVEIILEVENWWSDLYVCI